MALPNELAVYAREMSNFTSNRFKIEVQGGGASAKAGNIISVLLPDNSIIDMHSLRMAFRAEMNQFNGSDSAVGYSVLANDARSLIQSLAVFINGVAVQQNMPEYNTLCHVLGIADNNLNRQKTIDNILSNGLMEAGSDGSALPAAPQGDYIIDKWRGALQENNMRFWDTSLLGSVQIRLTLAPAAAVVSPWCKTLAAGGDGGASKNIWDISNNLSSQSYELKDIHFTIDAISLGVDYSQMLRDAISMNGALPIQYREYYSFPLTNITGTNYTNRFSLGCQSLNALYTVQRRKDYADGTGFDKADWAAAATPTRTSTPHWTGAYLNSEATGGSGSLIHPYYVFKSFTPTNTPNERQLNGDMTYQYSINNVSWPQTPATLTQAAADLTYFADKTDPKRDFGPLVSSMGEFKEAKCVLPVRLAFNDDIALLSGYNTRGINSTISVSVKGLTKADGTGLNGFTAVGGIDVNTFASTSATLKAEPGKAIAVSY
tara:strand:- start:5753 stop:7219 length:1467 start_codon:yes stop_codon:yes gene_type:complete